MKTENNQIGFLLKVLGGLILLSFVISRFGYFDPPARPNNQVGSPSVPKVEHASNPIHANVRWCSDGVIIFNHDSYNWNNVWIKLDGLIGGYKVEISNIPSKEFVTIPYSEFYDSNGNRFDNRTKRASSILIYVKGKDGVMFSR